MLVDNFKIYLWVTSRCNLDCQFCNSQHTIKQDSNYAMSLSELKEFIESSKLRNLHYTSICLAGGEVTLWKYLEEGVKLLFDSKICDGITLTTNGNEPEKIIKIEHMLKFWVVSLTQASEEQAKQYDAYKHKIVYNDTPHKAFPTQPRYDLLPANCCSRIERKEENIEYNGLLYLKGNIYFCTLAHALSPYVDLNEENLVCSFYENFLDKFSQKTYNKRICAYCLCNTRIWKVL